MSTPAPVLEAWQNLNDNWHSAEHSHYEQEHGDEIDPSEIPTAELHSSNYKDMRVIEDYLYPVYCFVVFLVLIVSFLGAHFAPEPDDLRVLR